VLISVEDVAIADQYLDAGATHIIVMTGHPFDLEPIESLIERRDT
jgi:poly-gamma-glutamate capsule biosynthesis protein CapA/YwtB (metallophosphatase superfamily)